MYQRRFFAIPIIAVVTVLALAAGCDTSDHPQTLLTNGRLITKAKLDQPFAIDKIIPGSSELEGSSSGNFKGKFLGGTSGSTSGHVESGGTLLLSCQNHAGENFLLSVKTKKIVWKTSSTDTEMTFRFIFESSWFNQLSSYRNRDDIEKTWAATWARNPNEALDKVVTIEITLPEDRYDELIEKL